MATIATLVGGVGALLFVPWLLVMFGLSLAFPFLCFSVVRSARTIARELQRANDYREHYEHGVRSGPLGT